MVTDEEKTKAQLLDEVRALRQQVADLHTVIATRKQAEEELIRLSSVVSTSTDSIVLTDLEGKIIEVNAATLELHGVGDKGDLIGKSAFDFIAPEDRERAF